MFNIFKKKTSDPSDPNQMGFMQRIAMKKAMSMSEEERIGLMQKMLTPENIAKNRDQILAAMEQMKLSGQMSADQIEEAKKRLGLN